MLKWILILITVCLPNYLIAQESSIESFLADSSMSHASVSLCILDAADGKPVLEHDSGKSLIPASIFKLITSAAALELLGPEHTFKTYIGYSGTLDKNTGRLSGNIIIKGGGDPTLGSEYFSDHYGDFTAKWTEAIKNAGIKNINGRIITDDSYFDYLPVPAKWLWEDAGNYYGAGTYGLSVFDNTYKIHFRTLSDSMNPVITGIEPEVCRVELSNRLVASGSTDEGYVFAAPYSSTGWLAGAIPANKDDFVLKASISDPPLLIAKIFDQKLKEMGIKISGTPTTARLQPMLTGDKLILISETTSPPLKEIIEILNHYSINLYAEHLTKELGRLFKNSGTTLSGVRVIKEFLSGIGIEQDGMFIEDGSGLSTLDAVNSKDMADMLLYMKKHGKYFNEYFNSLAEAGKEGTLRYYFKDPVFGSRFKAKGGSMTRVRSFAGYLKTNSGKELIFCIIVNHYSGPSQKIISGIEKIVKETIMYR